MKDRYDLPCNIAQTLNLIGDRWTLLIIHEILVGRTTFSEIKSALKGLSSKLLSDRLKDLEELGLIRSNLYSIHPPRYEYKPTPSGQELETVFHAFLLWGRNNLKKCYKKLVHVSCGHEVRLVCYCEHCRTNVDDVAAIELEPSATR